MKFSASESWLCKPQPLMKAPNRTEFCQRLQWLSEGMLHAHLQNWDHPDVRAREVQDYQVFCQLRDYEKGCGLLAAAPALLASLKEMEDYFRGYRDDDPATQAIFNRAYTAILKVKG